MVRFLIFMVMVQKNFKILSNYYLFLCLLLFGYSCKKKNSFEKEIPNLLNNLEIKNVESIYSNNEIGGFNEGYYIEIYKIPNVFIEDFIKNNNKKIISKSGWKTSNWLKTPINSTFEDIQILALNYHTDSPELKNKLNDVKKVLNDQNGFYSFYYKEVEGVPNSVQIFVIDIKENIIYIIENKV